jgi:tight adherence protein B
MLFDELWLVYGLTFGAVLLGSQALYWLLTKERTEKRIINRRLVLTAQLNNPNDVLETLRKERGIEWLARASVFKALNELILQSGLRFSLASAGLTGIALFLLYTVLLTVSTGSISVALALAIPAVAGSLYLLLHIARNRRIAAFTEQFPDAIDVVVRGLKAGHPFRVALALVAREMPDPIGSEFGIVADEITFGLEQSTAIDHLCRRVGQGDLAFFATAVNVQHQTGGNLGEILARLSRLLRNRSKLRLKIRALSSEGRLSAIALSLAPFVLFAIISLISPDYFGAVRNHPVVQLGAGVGLVLLAIGNFVMYRMVNFKF